MSQAIEAAIELGFIREPIDYDSERIITTHPFSLGKWQQKG